MNQKNLLEPEIEDGTVLEPTALVACPNPMEILSRAVDQGMSVETIEKLMELSQRWEANEERKADKQAEKEFNAAMALCQAEMGPAVATQKNTQTNSLYADRFDVDKVARPIYTKHGFSLTFSQEKSELERHIRVTAKVRHSAGHCETYSDDYPIDDVGFKGSANKTPIQGKGSSFEYACRYMTKGIFNIVVRDGADNDGNRAAEAIDAGQIAALNKEMDLIHPDDNPLDKLLAWAGIESLDQLPTTKFNAALQSLRKQADKYRNPPQ